MKVNQDWPLILSNMMTGAVADPHAVYNLALAQWNSMQRMMFGGFLPGHDDAHGTTKTLKTDALSGQVRTAQLFVPDNVETIHSLVVMVHGCMQDSDAFARLTGMSAIAAKQGFAVLYPDQETAENPMNCWNWYAPENQRRIGGEPEALARLIEQAQLETKVTAARTHIAGISAGGAQTALMIHLYPELLSSAVIVAGPLPFVANTLPEALNQMAKGPSQRETRSAERSAALETAFAPVQGKHIPVLIIHGKHDDLVAFRNAESQAEAVVELDDMLDNRLDDNSVHARKEEAHGVFGEIEVWRDEVGLPLAVLVGPRALGHAWSGGNPDEPFSQAGFDLSRMATEFFQAAETGDWAKFTLRKMIAELKPG